MKSPEHRVGPQTEQPAIGEHQTAQAAPAESPRAPTTAEQTGTVAGRDLSSGNLSKFPPYVRSHWANSERVASCLEACAGIPDPIAAIAQAREALRAIVEGAGPFSRDPLTHAANCIEAMKAHARTALAALEGRQP